MFNDLKDKLRKLSDFYSEFPDKKSELLGYKNILDTYEIVEELNNNQFFKKNIEDFTGRLSLIDTQILSLARSPTKNLEELMALYGEKDAIEKIVKRFSLPDINIITTLVEEEVDYLKENGRTI